MYIVCAEHLAMAIDEFIEEFGTAPDIYELGKVTFTDWTAPSQCEFCEEASVYLIV
ncbi:MAG: CxxH/CxxC protein [Firmicutes bacterium]|jgi:CxxH/CxxC protein (TIGR04129 family)|nr:CxxH/CxxC protein [Bacillota bacterium]NLO65625.1 CxxH/CxxC protein [Bacillota bacterium]